MRTSSRSVAVVLFDEVEILDVAGVLQVLTLAGRSWNFRPFKILTVGAAPGLVETRNQLRIEARHSRDDVPHPEIVVVPGGYGARRGLGDAGLVEWLASAGQTATHVVAVGNGVLLLGKAGLVANTDVSAAADVAPLLAELAPTARTDSVARWRDSGRILTARTPGGAVDAALHLVGAALGKKQAEAVAAALGVDGDGSVSKVEIVS